MNNFISDLKYRHSIVKYALRFGPTRASDHFNISRSFVYKFINMYDGTLNSLKRKSKRPLHHPNESTKAEYDLIKNYHRRNPDNGIEFTNRLVMEHPKPTLFETTLKELGITHKLIKPYTPRHNGKVERSHGKDQLYFYNNRTFFNLNDLETQVSRRMYEYNRFPMKPLGWLSPIEFLDNYTRTH